MAHSMLKPYSLLMYFLAVLVFFFIGVTYAGLIDAGKNQMLAGAAIVLGYGVMVSISGLIIALFVAYKSSRKTIFRINLILTLLIVLFVGYFTVKYNERQSQKLKEETEQPEKPKPSTTVTSDNNTAHLSSQTMKFETQYEYNIGLGMFAPKLFNTDVFYFYDKPNLDKAIIEHSPTDSITFKKLENGGYDITTAPPWLVPEHLKLDYDILYFRMQSISQDFIEVTVNSITGQTKYVDRNSGKILYWPEFLLKINSVEFLNPHKQKIHIKPQESSSIINSTYSFMKPLQISRAWMYVELVDDDYNSVGKGWIKWMENEKLLIKYSLLS